MITFIKEQVVGDDNDDGHDQANSKSNRQSSPVDVSRKRKRSGGETLDVPLQQGRLAEIRKIAQRYQERTD